VAKGWYGTVGTRRAGLRDGPTLGCKARSETAPQCDIVVRRSLLDEVRQFSPRGKVLENGMPRFFRRLAEGVFDEEDLIRRAHELSDFIEEAAAHYNVDSKKVVGVGYSNGANIAGAMLLLRPNVLCGAALLRPMLPLIPERMPELNGVPVLVSAGNQDPIVPSENARELVTLLRQAGADVTVCFENAGHHNITDTTFETTRRWLAEKVK
jgi:phospholipase/carboxylesterase